jgi:hypothetical protein
MVIAAMPDHFRLKPEATPFRVVGVPGIDGADVR